MNIWNCSIKLPVGLLSPVAQRQKECCCHALAHAFAAPFCCTPAARNSHTLHTSCRRNGPPSNLRLFSSFQCPFPVLLHFLLHLRAAPQPHLSRTFALRCTLRRARRSKFEYFTSPRPPTGRASANWPPSELAASSNFQHRSSIKAALLAASNCRSSVCLSVLLESCRKSRARRRSSVTKSCSSGRPATPETRTGARC